MGVKITQCSFKSLNIKPNDFTRLNCKNEMLLTLSMFDVIEDIATNHSK